MTTHRFVLISPNAQSALASPVCEGMTIERIDTDAAMWLVETSSPSDQPVKQLWQALRILEPNCVVVPAPESRNALPRYPTGLVVVRLKPQTQASEVARMADKHQTHLMPRSKFSPHNVVLTPLDGLNTFLPDLVAQLAAEPWVEAAWMDCRSAFKRAPTAGDDSSQG